MKKVLTLALALILIVSAGAAAGCSSEPTGEEPLELGYVNWACATANSYLVRNILINEFDTDVTLRSMDAGLMWQAVSTGDLDFMVTAWLPNTHADYYAEVKDDVVDLGPVYEGAQIGLVVPTYVTIDSIEELNENADKFNGQIVGIDSGAGIMKATDAALVEYDMQDMELMTSSDAAMTAELKTSYDQEEWVVVTGWAPHWKFAEFDLKFLEDTKNVYGGEETINAISRLGFADDQPEIAAFLENYYMSPAELGELIGMMEEYDDNDEAAQAWITDNQDKIDGWLA